jgi:alkylated DNA repair protein alkB family protein 8
MFNRIAEDWGHKRKKPWQPFTTRIAPWLIDINNLEKTSSLLVLDLGCGTGRHSGFFLQFARRLIDLDASREMLRLNPSSSLKIHADMTALPLRENLFDAIFSVATLHHIRTALKREQVIHEMTRMGIPNALVCVVVWRLYQKKFLLEMLSQLEQFTFASSEHEIGDVEIPWTVSRGDAGQNVKVMRFYHLFLIPEFRKLMSPFRTLQRGTLGNRDEKTNFYFIGVIQKKRLLS